MAINVSQTTEELPFKYRYTDDGEGNPHLEIGDRFELSDSFSSNDDAAYLMQVGASMVMAGLQFLGVPPEDARLYTALALSHADGEYWTPEK